MRTIPSTARWVATSWPREGHTRLRLVWSGDGAATANSGGSDVDNDETDDNASYASSVAVERMVFEQEIQEASSSNDDDAVDR